jgi:FixJ family two-component response regulator
MTDARQPDSMTEAEVFVVDDDAPVRRALDRLLRSAGYRVRTFGSAQELLAGMEHHSPACLIVDVRMPEVNGLDLFELLRKENALAPIIFITGHGDIAMAVRAMKAGALDFLAKPFDDEALLDAVALAVQKGS